MKKWTIGILLILLMVGPVYAIELCVTITAATDAQAGRQAARIGTTKEALARQALNERLTRNRSMRKDELLSTYSNYSAFCAGHNYCD